MAKNRRGHNFRDRRLLAGRIALSRPRVEIDRGLAWYVVYCGARRERHAQDDLSRYATHLPTQAFKVHRRGRLVDVEEVPASRYLFVGLPMPEPDFAAVEQALGWVPSAWLQAEPPRGYLLRDPSSQEPLRVGAGALQAYVDACADNGLSGLANGRSPFRAGERARIIEGACAGLEMKIEDVLCDRRIRGLVDMLGGRVVVEATADQLEAA